MGLFGSVRDFLEWEVFLKLTVLMIEILLTAQLPPKVTQTMEVLIQKWFLNPSEYLIFGITS